MCFCSSRSGISRVFNVGPRHQSTYRSSLCYSELSTATTRASTPPFSGYDQLLSSILTISRSRSSSSQCNARRPNVPGSRPVKWTTEATQAFSYCKETLSNCALLAHPLAEAPLAIVTDASDFAMEAALQQLVDNAWQPLGFISRKFTPTQQKYSPHDHELLAIYSAVKYLRNMLEALHCFYGLQTYYFCLLQAH
jgi:hypothetical protein